MRNLLALLSLSVFISACEKEKIVEVIKEPEYKWKSHNSFVHDYVVQMNSYASDDLLFFYGVHNFTSIAADSTDHPDSPLGGTVAHYNIFEDQLENKKVSICSDYSIAYNQINGYLRFFPTISPALSGGSSGVLLSSIDSTYNDFYFMNFQSGECMAINDLNQSLIPYRSFSNSGYSLKLALIDIKFKDLDKRYVDTPEVKTIAIPDEYQYKIFSLKSIGNYFFISTDSKSYRIDKQGNIEAILDTRTYKFFEYSGKFYATSIDSIYVSHDNGLTWSNEGTIPREFTSINLSYIDGKLVLYRNAQLWELIINETGLIFNELDSDGLDGISITSVSEFDNKVYLSTLSGVYFKSIEDFFEYKMEEPEIE